MKEGGKSYFEAREVLRRPIEDLSLQSVQPRHWESLSEGSRSLVRDVWRGKSADFRIL